MHKSTFQNSSKELIKIGKIQLKPIIPATFRLPIFYSSLVANPQTTSPPPRRKSRNIGDDPPD